MAHVIRHTLFRLDAPGWRSQEWLSWSRLRSIVAWVVLALFVRPWPCAGQTIMMSGVEQDLVVAARNRVIARSQVRLQPEMGFARAPMQLERSVAAVQLEFLPTRIGVEVVRGADGAEMLPVAASSTVRVPEKVDGLVGVRWHDQMHLHLVAVSVDACVAIPGIHSDEFTQNGRVIQHVEVAKGLLRPTMFKFHEVGVLAALSKPVGEADKRVHARRIIVVAPDIQLRMFPGNPDIHSADQTQPAIVEPVDLHDTGIGYEEAEIRDRLQCRRE